MYQLWTYRCSQEFELCNFSGFWQVPEYRGKQTWKSRGRNHKGFGIWTKNELKNFWSCYRVWATAQHLLLLTTKHREIGRQTKIGSEIERDREMDRDVYIDSTSNIGCARMF